MNDEKFEILGGEDIQYVFRINEEIKNTNLGRLIINYLYISNEHFKNVALLNNEIEKEKNRNLRKLRQ